MCFSASASFIASGSLAVLGGASFAAAKKKEKVMALIPFLFAVQQFFEGIQWLYLYQSDTAPYAAYIFLFFALMVWPIYVPVAVFVLDKKRRSILKWFIVLGSAVALYFFYILQSQILYIGIEKSCVIYGYRMPGGTLANTAYIIAVLVPLFLSSKPVFRWFGVMAFILGVIAVYFYTYNFTSVWCFFAAIVSSIFFVYIKYNNK